MHLWLANREENTTFNSGTLLPENHWNRNLSERAMLPCFNDQTWTQVDLPPGRQARQATRGGWIRKGQKSEHGAVDHLKSGLPQKDIPETGENDVESSSVCLLEKCIYGLQIGTEYYFQLWTSPS